MAHTQQGLAYQGWRWKRLSASWTLHLRKAISFATVEKVKKCQAVSECSEVPWGRVGCVREEYVLCRGGWSCVCSEAFCCVTMSLLRTLNHHLSTTLLSPYLSHFPKTSVTSTDHQKPKSQTPKFLSLAFKAKDSPDIPQISCLQAFVLCFLNT